MNTIRIFALRHPFITLLVVGAVCNAAINIAQAVFQESECANE